MLNKLATIVYFLCFKKQTLELLLHLSFNHRFLQMACKIFLSGFEIYPDVKKLLRGHRAILSYLGLNFPQIQSR